MSKLKDIAYDVACFGVGAAAVVVDAASHAAKALVRKGDQTLKDNQDTVDALKRKVKDLTDKAKAQMESVTAEPTVDASAMTPEERAELRRQLDEADAAAAQPVEPDEISHTDEPAPVEEAVPEEESAPVEESPVDEPAPAEDSADEPEIPVDEN